MKNILLATTALVVTAGFASAEVTFSGRGEAGVYRLAPKAAVAAVAGGSVTAGSTALAVESTVATTVATSAQANGDASHTANATDFIVGWVDGVLTVTKPTDGVANAAATNAATTATTTATAKSIRSWEDAVAVAKLALATAEALVGNSSVQDDQDSLTNRVEAAKANLAAAELVLATAKGTAAVAAGATPDTKAYSGYDLDVAVSGASDNGMTFSMGFDIGAGQIADSTDDLAIDNMGTTFVAEELVIGYNGYTVKIGDNLMDDLYDDTQNGDVSLSGTIGALSFGIVTDMDKDTAAVAATHGTFAVASGAIGADTYKGAKFTAGTAAVAAVWETTSYSLGYKAGDVAFSLVGTDGNDIGEAAMKVSASAPLGDFKFTASIDNKGKADDIAKLAVSYTTGGLTLTASSADDANHSLSSNKDGKASYDVGLSYAMGAATVQYNTDESAAWWANAQYNLGGGANAFATINHDDFAVAGVKFTF